MCFGLETGEDPLLPTLGFSPLVLHYSTYTKEKPCPPTTPITTPGHQNATSVEQRLFGLSAYSDLPPLGYSKDGPRQQQSGSCPSFSWDTKERPNKYTESNRTTLFPFCTTGTRFYYINCPGKGLLYLHLQSNLVTF